MRARIFFQFFFRLLNNFRESRFIFASRPADVSHRPRVSLQIRDGAQRVRALRPRSFFMKNKNSKKHLWVSRKVYHSSGAKTAIFLSLLIEQFRNEKNEIQFYTPKPLSITTLMKITGFGRRVVEQCLFNLQCVESCIFINRDPDYIPQGVSDVFNTNCIYLDGETILELFND